VSLQWFLAIMAVIVIAAVEGFLVAVFMNLAREYVYSRKEQKLRSRR
jgi:uncharacterized integral membrane protein